MSTNHPRERGTGGLFQRRSDGRWVGTIEAGFNAAGKRRRKTITAMTEKAAKTKLNATKAEIARTGTTVTASMTLSRWLAIWLDSRQVKPTTLANYRQTVRLYIDPALGRRRIDRIDRQHIREMHQWMAKKDLSLSTIHRAHRVLVAALNDAVTEGIVVRNVAASVKSPQPAKDSDRPAMTVEQVYGFLRANDADPMAARWFIALTLGVRQGEALGLEWSRIDLDRGLVDVSWQLQRLPYRHGCTGDCGRKRPGSCPSRELDIPRGFEHRVLRGGLCLTRPKSRVGKRLVPLPARVWAAMRLHRQRSPGNSYGLVFATETGEPVDPSDDNAAWHVALDRAGLPSVALHAARHTAATWLESQGVSQDTRMAMLGHNSAAVSAHYLHVDLDSMRAATGRIDASLDLVERLAREEVRRLPGSGT